MLGQTTASYHDSSVTTFRKVLSYHHTWSDRQQQQQHTAIKACRKLRVLSMGVSASMWLLGMNLSWMIASRRWARLRASC